MKEKFSLKDALFNKTNVARLAAEIAAVYPPFETDAFTATILDRIPKLELKQRISWIREQLQAFLPPSYPEALRIILAALPPPLDPTLTDDDFGEFIYAPYGEFIAVYGCTSEHLPRSLSALREVTMRFSAEDAIRYFINKFPEQTLRQLTEWSTDHNYHVRRLVSEGSRPKLPWSQKIVFQPEQTVPLLDALFADKTRYVTRSVANHMNDISKIKPELVLHTLDRWQASGKQTPSEMEFIIKHSLRTLVKKGYPGAIAFLNFSADPQVTVSDISLNAQTIPLGGVLEFSVTITAQKSERLLIDYIISFQNKAGSMNSKKVFKLKQCQVTAGTSIHLRKKHRFMTGMTTRTLYPGNHLMELQINGKTVAQAPFLLVEN